MGQQTIPVLKDKFADGKTPNGSDFGDFMDSYYHRSSRISQNNVLGLVDELSNKADKTDLQNIVGGMINKGEVANKTDLPTNGEKGWAYIVTNEKDTNGNSYIYQYDGLQWNNTGLTAFPKDVLTANNVSQTTLADGEKVLLSKNGEIPYQGVYKPGQKGLNIPTILKAVKALYIENAETAKKYFITTVRRNNIASGGTISTSEIAIYKSNKDLSNKEQVGRFVVDGDPANGTVQLLTFGTATARVYVYIIWDNLPDNTSYTNMFDGYELDESCLTKNTNFLSVKQNIDAFGNIQSYLGVYKIDQQGGNIPAILKAVKCIYIEGADATKRYFLTAIRRNNNGQSEIAIYKSDRDLNNRTAVGRYSVNGDPASGSLQLVTLAKLSTETRILAQVLWDYLPDNTSYTNMFDGYELDQTSFLNLKAVNILNGVEQNASGIADINNKLFNSYENKKLNIIPDPHFVLADFNLTEAVNPLFIAIADNYNLNIENDTIVLRDSKISAKGIQILVSFSNGWADRFGLKAGDKIKIGCYVKFDYSSNATLTRWGTQANVSLPYTYTPSTNYLSNADVPKGVYKWIERMVTLKSDGTDLNQRTDLSLAYIQLTDPDAASIPTTICIKNPCIIIDQERINSVTGFYESYRSDLVKSQIVNTDYLRVNKEFTLLKLIAQNIELTGYDINLLIRDIQANKVNTRWIELANNYAFPTKGKFLGLKGMDLYLCIDGVETKLN